MRRITHYYRRAEEELYKKLHLFRFYFTNFGLKNIGASQLIEATSFHGIEVIELQPNQLFLGPDFLKDQYSLLDRSIYQSPHYDFVRAQKNGNDLMSTEYIKRYIAGTLDWRRGTYKPTDYIFFHNQYETITTAIHDGVCPPVITYQMSERYYIFDGKHRAAICAMLDVPVNTIVVNSEIANANVWHYMFALIDEKKEYSKHTDFHKRYLETIK